MLAQDYLTLRLVRLKSPEEWVHQREGLSFIFPKGGSGKYLVRQVVQRLGPGDVLVVNEGGGGKLCVSNGGEMVFWSFSLSLEHLFPLFAGNEIALLQNVTDGLKGLKVYPASSPLAAECHRLLAAAPPQFNLDHRGQLLRVAAAILSEEFKTAHGQRVGFVRVEEHMLQVFENLPADELLSLSVSELASKFGCSRRHLNRLFHHYFGFAVAALRMEMRLIKAVSLLRDPHAKIINVAEQCGFNHLGLFNTCFKRRFGTSPGQWRKTVTQAAGQAGAGMAADADCPLHSNGLCPWSGRPQNAAPLAPKTFRPGKAKPARVLPIADAADENPQDQAVAVPPGTSNGEKPRQNIFQNRV